MLHNFCLVQLCSSSRLANEFDEKAFSSDSSSRLSYLGASGCLRDAGSVGGTEPTGALIFIPRVMVCFSWGQEIVIFIGKLYIVASKVYHCRFTTKPVQCEILKSFAQLFPMQLGLLRSSRCLYWISDG